MIFFKEGTLRSPIVYAMVLGACFFNLFAPFSSVQAATEPYKAEVSTGSVTLAPGATKAITLKFKNVGTQTWTRGKSATAVYLYGESSVFGHASWLGDDLPALIEQATVKPGAMASAVFLIRAPATPGTYTERFLLSYGPNAWIKGSVVTVTFTVAVPPPAQVVSTTPPNAIADPIPSSTEYRAELINKGGIEWQIQPGERVGITMTFKNTGTKSWRRDGTNYVSLYTWAPKYRKSPFKNSTWKSDAQPVVLKELEVKPGQIGTFHLQLVAPDVTGQYQETFQLAAENLAWITGGSVTLPIRVGDTSRVVTAPAPNASASTPTAPSASATYQSVLLLTSQKSITTPGSERLQLTHGFKNAGTAVWQNRALKLVSISPELGTVTKVQDASWPSSNEAVKATGATAPGEIGFVSYMLKAPAKRGEYTVTFRLMADGQEVEGGDVTIPVTVTSDGYVDPEPILVPAPVVGVPPLGGAATLPAEPIIRVGLYKTTDNTLMVRGLRTGMVVTQNGTNVCTFDQGQVATIVYDRANKVYKISGPGCTGQSTGWYVVTASDGASPLEITDYSRPVSWLPGANDNKFRAKLELRFTPATDAVWVINELLLESYLNGIAETSNVSPLEYQKALLTAARTYALYHVNRGTKHANEFYHVDAHLDQVYRGYGQEERSPNIVAGVAATRGQIVTYDGKLAITPYYSRSDGRTRDWTEVWGGSGYAWLKSVPVPHDVGQTLWGHGVGMSARGALYMASRDGALYDQILKHFYTGIELRRAYQ